MAGSGEPYGSEAAPIDVAVAIVGYGPIGQALAILLGRASHSVAVFERFERPYNLPRAVHIDHEIMRLLQGLGVARELEEEMLAVDEYLWFGADGDPLLTIRPAVPASSGWEPDYLFYQPTLEDALDRAARAQPSVAVHRGWTAQALDQDEDRATLALRRSTGAGDPPQAPAETRSVTARWVLGADGANSFVRESEGIASRDLGFQERWLVVDIDPHDAAALDGLAPACQWCDPRRPTTHIRSGRRRHRWEFMLLPGELEGDFAGDGRAWELLEPWCTPADAILTRSAVYEFRSMLAERMRSGRALLVGDAAHLTPPFMGQGLCCGLRDAANVAWKLDLVLRGLAPEELLDTLDDERQVQNEWIIALAMGLGRVLCELDPAAAAERDVTLRAAGDPPPLELAPLSGGLIRRGEDGGPGPLAGTLSVQGRVSGPGGEGLFDDVVGGGFTLLVASGDPLAGLTPPQRSLLEELPCTLASLETGAPCAVLDLDGRLAAWLAEHGVHAVLVRPDLYVFGAAGSPGDTPALLEELRMALDEREVRAL
jgi:2-polyprenyl-6-methoxyphenol hydroxylase-like FAD-dependent oxidoreductase